MNWSRGARGLAKGALLVLAIAAAFLAWVGVLTLFRHGSCDRLDAERVSHLEPGHDTRGPDSVYVKGVGPGPPPSEISEYWGAVAAMQRAGCDVPASDSLP